MKDKSDLDLNILEQCRETSIYEGESGFSINPDFKTLKNFKETWYWFNGFGFWEANKHKLVEGFKSWSKQGVWLVFHDPESNQLVFRKASKRGNDVFKNRCLFRLIPVLRKMKRIPKEYFVQRVGRSKRFKASVVAVTLKTDPNQPSFMIPSIWRDISRRIDDFVKAMEKRYGKCFVLKGSIEAEYHGFPHVHMIMVFPFHKFDCFYWDDHYRIEGKKEKLDYNPIEDLWKYGWSDIYALKNTKQVYSYGFKYGIKAYGGGYDKLSEEKKEKMDLTLALNWIFRKHSFTFRRKELLNSILRDRIKGCSSRTDFNGGGEKKLILLGIIAFSYPLDRPPPKFFVVDCESVFGKEVLDSIIKP